MTLLAEVGVYDALLAAVALATITLALIGFRDRMRRNLREERDELQRQNVLLKTRLETSEAKPDMTKLADLLEQHETHAAERADRQFQRDDHHIRILRQIAEALDIKLRNGRT